MFDNIGSKIKWLARIVCYLGIAASMVCGLVILVVGSEYGDEARAVFGGFMVIIVGSLLSWIGSFLVYGFGQLIDNSDKLVKLKNNNP